MIRRLVLLALLGACSAQHVDRELPGFAQSGSFGERTRVLSIEPGVTATLVAPSKLDFTKRVDLILYALPNGNSTAETMGRRLTDSISWRYDIQHIAAQTRALREHGFDQAVVVYLEADKKSWPAWRSRNTYDKANPRIVQIVDQLRQTLGNPENLVVSLTGHSGGGSFIWGFIEGQDALPDWLERIVFLDANYSYEPRHGVKIADWLRRKPEHTMVVVAYDDRDIIFDGKKVVSDDGGTWRASHRMLDYFSAPFALKADTLGDFLRYRGAQIQLVLHPNSTNRILHTEMIGEMNAYMHAMLVNRPGYSDVTSLLIPTRAYTPWVER